MQAVERGSPCRSQTHLLIQVFFWFEGPVEAVVLDCVFGEGGAAMSALVQLSPVKPSKGRGRVADDPDEHKARTWRRRIKQREYVRTYAQKSGDRPKQAEVGSKKVVVSKYNSKVPSKAGHRQHRQ